MQGAQHIARTAHDFDVNRVIARREVTRDVQAIRRLPGNVPGERAIDGSLALSEYLLEKVKVAIVPGIGFGADANIRLSYATSMQQIEKGLDRIAEALGAL